MGDNEEQDVKTRKFDIDELMRDIEKVKEQGSEPASQEESDPPPDAGEHEQESE
jgi:hypothetical protein